MKTFDQIISQRRSVRNYLDRPVEEEKLRAVLEAAREAPSACNAQPWRFVAVIDPVLRDSVAARGLGGVVPNAWAKTAPVIIVVCSTLELLTHRVGEAVQGVSYHLIDLGIAMEHVVLKATELELGTCYIGWFNAKPIHKLLDLSPSWKVECLITLGYPAEIPGLSSRKDLSEICIIR
ncbi:MAG: nitroreductase family protein [Endomicrobiales bacterium]|jgi:nitroreductase